MNAYGGMGGVGVGWVGGRKERGRGGVLLAQERVKKQNFSKGRQRGGAQWSRLWPRAQPFETKHCQYNAEGGRSDPWRLSQVPITLMILRVKRRQVHRRFQQDIRLSSKKSDATSRKLQNIHEQMVAYLLATNCEARREVDNIILLEWGGAGRGL